VQVDLQDGWSITIPGAMAEQWEPEGENWSAWDGRRTVWFHRWTFSKKTGGVPSAEEVLAMAEKQLPEGERFEHRTPRVLGLAALAPHEEDGKAMLNLKAFSAVPGGLALCNVFFDDPADRDWAVATWHSLEPPAPPAENAAGAGGP
jgi:hypothetical protein